MKKVDQRELDEAKEQLISRYTIESEDSEKVALKLLEEEINGDGKEYYKYKKVVMLRKFNFKGFLRALEQGKILVDFDARTGHNHGTKFRMRQDCLPMLYAKSKVII